MANQRLLRVLIVDDENSIRLSLEMALKMTNNFVVESCDSGDTAVEILKKEDFDVIVLDNRMPGMSGIDVLEWMHQQKLDIPVIMITGAGSEEIAVEAIKHGVYDYVRKDQLGKDRLALAVKSVHERHMYKRAIIEREAEERVLREKQKELDALQSFHTTVNSLGQLVERGLAALTEKIKKHQEIISKSANADMKEQWLVTLKDLEQDVQVVSSGVSSMRNLSTVVIHKLDEIHIVPKQNAQQEP
ncbi:MAG: response regulator [Ignavibacteriales bacterium]|nr:response regulator [Ignavibacteriales bacterium]